MSIRAYKVIEIKQEEVPTFNLEENTELATLLGINPFDLGTGLIEFRREDLQAAFDKAKEVKTKEILTTMLLHAATEGYVYYYCH